MNKFPHYRELIYKDYTKILELAPPTKNIEKEQRLLDAYIKRNYLPQFPQNKNIRILDVACGRGNYIEALIKLGYNNIVGIDLSESNVQYCQQKGLDVQEISLEEFLPKVEKTYDVILFNDIIEHFTKQEIVEALLMLKNALKDNGVLIVKTINAANPYVAASGRYIVFDHEISFVDISLRQVLVACGFSNVVVKGADIYIMGGPLEWIAKPIARFICFTLFLRSALFGRFSIKIFEKSIIAFARK